VLRLRPEPHQRLGTGQLAQLRAAGCEKRFREKITGATADRPQLKKLMAALTHGDVVICGEPPCATPSIYDPARFYATETQDCAGVVIVA
jgi:hypothetical protein